MSLHRYAAKRDDNEEAIVEALTAVGCTVARLSGAGVPDLVVGRAGELWLLEVKSRTGTETNAQHAWRQWWRGPEPYIVRSVDEALRLVGVVR